MTKLLRMIFVVLLIACALPCAAQTNLLTNPGFEQLDARGIPVGWRQYAGGVPESQLKAVPDAHSGQTALRLTDTGPNERDQRYCIGLQQEVPVEAGKFYLGTVWAKALARNHEQAAILQLTFLPGNQSSARFLTGPIGGDWQRFSVGVTAPDDAKTCRVYLYTMHFWTTETIVDDASLEVLDEKAAGLGAALWRWGHEPLREARPLKLQTVIARDNAPAAVIACPKDPEWKQVAMDLQTAIQRKTGATLMLHTDTKPLLRGDQTIIALGNMNNNFVIERLYFNHYTKADSLFPGPGNYALRTVHQPFNFGDINVLNIEASDLEGAQAGVAELLRRLPDGGNCSLDKPLLFVSTTRPADEAGIKRIVDTKVTQDLFVDFWNAVQKYRETGEIAWALRAKRIMGLCAQRLVKDPQYHITWPEETTSDQIGAMWDVIEEAPVWTDDERLQAINCLFSTMLGMPRLVTYWGSFANNDTVIFNHSSFPLLGMFFIDRYLGRYYKGQDSVFEEYMAQVKGAFDGQVKSWKPQCDADGYLTIVPKHTIDYTLAQNDYTYFENGQVRQLAEYLSAICDPMGSNPGFGDSGIGKGPSYEITALPLAFWYYKDGRYLWRLQQIYDGKWKNPFDQTIGPVEWKELAGLNIWRMAPEFYRWYTTVPQYGEMFKLPGVSLEQGFDKIAFRGDTTKDCEWMLLDGIARGKHLHYDGNAIIKYRAGGEDWLVDGDYLIRNTTEHNMVSVIKNGRADVLEPPLARLDAYADLDTCAFTRSSVPDYNGSDWTRNILWLKGLGFVVMDEMKANEDAEFTFERIWKTQDIGQTKLTDGRVLSVTRPTGGGSGSRSLTPVSDFLPEVPKAVKFGAIDSRLEFPVDLPAGQYAVTLWAQGKDSGTDSMWVSVDGGEETAFHIPYDKFGPSADAWTKDTKTPNVTIKKDGTHAFRISLRENPGIVLQKIVIAAADGKELKMIEAWNPPALPQNMVKAAPDARFFIKGDGQAQTELTSRTNNINLKFRYLREVAAGPMKAGQSAQLASIFYYDRSDKPLNLQLRRVSEDTLAIDRDGKPWGVLITDGQRNDKWNPEVMFFTADRQISINTPNPDVLPFSHELNLKDGTVVTYAQAETTVQIGGKNITVPKGKSSLAHLGGDWQQAAAFAKELLAKAAQPPTVAGPASRDEVSVSPALKPTWSLPATTQDDQTAVINCLKPADVDGDGTDEMLVGWGRYLVCVDNAGKQLWSLPTEGRVNDACVGDINGDGKNEVLIGSDDENFYIADSAGKLISKTHCDAPLKVGRSSVRDPRVSNVALGDIDADGKIDVIIGTRNGNICRYDANLKMLWRFDEIEHGTFGMRLLDLDGDGKLEIVTAQRYGAVEVVSHKGKAMPNTYSELGDVVYDIADMDGDGKLDVINGSSTGALVCGRWNESGKPLWRFDNFGYGVKDVRFGDFDADGQTEAAIASETGYVYLLDAEGKTKATQRLDGAVLSLAVLDAPRGKRLVAGCRDGMVYVLSGTLKPVSSLKMDGPVTWMSVQKAKDGKQTLVAAGGEGLAAVTGL